MSDALAGLASPDDDAGYGRSGSPVARLTVHPAGTHLLRAGEFFPLVVDTAWSAFADATIEEWRHYVATRRQQGFTSVAVSILPILHDRSLHPNAREPFSADDSGGYRFDTPNPAYFDTARAFARVAAAEGLVMCLVVLWVNYVEGTWGAELTPNAVMSGRDRRAYVSLVVRTFSEFAPIFVISGDEHFTDPRPIAIYSEVLAQIAAEASGCLTAMHSAPMADLPPAIADSPDLSLYVYQSGHDMTSQFYCHELAARYLGKPFRKPIINLEPVYEQLGHPSRIGRWTAADVRRAIWWSIIAGASAGIGYGAHGVWQWYTPGNPYTTAATLEPFPWRVALGFPGASDVSLAASLIRRHRLYELVPRQDLLATRTEGVRVAASPDESTVAVYVPSALAVSIRMSGSWGQTEAWSLADRRPIAVPMTESVGGLQLARPDILGDGVIFLDRREG